MCAFILSSADGHLGGFPLSGCVNSAAVSMCAWVREHLLSVLVGPLLGVGLLGHVLIPCLRF